MPEFTAERWAAHGAVVVRINDRTFAQVCCCAKTGRAITDRDRTNAQLIAAAPEMLAALLFAITDDPGAVIDRGDARRRLQAITLTAQAALAKATGGKNMTQTTAGPAPTSARIGGHTPGPWITLLSPGDVRVFSFGGQVIADVRNPTRVLTNDHSEEHANALLIAAAPSLLAALRALFSHYVTPPGGPYWLGTDSEHNNGLWRDAEKAIASTGFPAQGSRAASRVTQVQLFYQEQRNIAEGNALMLEMIEHGDITDRELDKLIARRPAKYSRFAHLRPLCRKETPLGDALDTLHANSATERGEEA